MKNYKREGNNVYELKVEQPSHEQERIERLDKILSNMSIEDYHNLDRQARDMASKKFGKAGHTMQAIRVCRYEILEEMTKEVNI